MDQNTDRITIFVCYASDDGRWVDPKSTHNLIPWLANSLRKHNVEFWVADKLKGSEEYREEIASAISRAKIAILLVDQPFLSSEFIEEFEIPRIQAGAKSRELVVLPILTKPCPWKENAFIESRQLLPKVSRVVVPLIECVGHDSQWANARAQIFDALVAQIKSIRENTVKATAFNDQNISDSAAGDRSCAEEGNPSSQTGRGGAPPRRFLRRRRVLPTLLAVLLLLIGLFTASWAFKGKLTITVGFIYVVDKDDYGCNQAQADGAAAVAKLPGVVVKEVENVPETRQGCEPVIETMINRGNASIIFTTTAAYFDPVSRSIAPKFPKVVFINRGGDLYKEGVPTNIRTYFAYLDETEYLCGMAAGSASKSGKLGFVAPTKAPIVFRDINAFELGAKLINPQCTLTVIFAGEHFDPGKEADAVTKFVDQGVDVVAGDVDSPKALIETAEKHGINSCGFYYNGSRFAPKGYLTGAEWDWTHVFVSFVNECKDGRVPDDRAYIGTLKNGAAKLSPFGPGVSTEAQDKIEAIKADMMADGFQIFKGPLKDNKGNEKIAKGQGFGDQDDRLWKMDYLVEGVFEYRPSKGGDAP